MLKYLYTTNTHISTQMGYNEILYAYSNMFITRLNLQTYKQSEFDFYILFCQTWRTRRYDITFCKWYLNYYYFKSPFYTIPSSLSPILLFDFDVPIRINLINFVMTSSSLSLAHLFASFSLRCHHSYRYMLFSLIFGHPLLARSQPVSRQLEIV